MKTIHKITTIVFTVLLTNCASVKLSDSWTSNDFEKTKNKKMLIVARSDDKEVRKTYEDELVKQLKTENINAVSALNMFPDLKENKNISETDKSRIVKQFTDAGIETIMLIALKDTKVTYVDNGVSSSSDPMIYNKGKYGLSFADYYNVHSIEYLSKDLRRNNPTEDINMPVESMSYSTYVIEAVVYDITLKANNQLVGSYEVEAKDPKSAEQVLNNFTKLIAKEFKK